MLSHEDRCVERNVRIPIPLSRTFGSEVAGPSICIGDAAFTVTAHGQALTPSATRLFLLFIFRGWPRHSGSQRSRYVPSLCKACQWMRKSTASRNRFVGSLTGLTPALSQVRVLTPAAWAYPVRGSSTRHRKRLRNASAVAVSGKQHRIYLHREVVWVLLAQF
jgi:hypothetical protein